MFLNYKGYWLISTPYLIIYTFKNSKICFFFLGLEDQTKKCPWLHCTLFGESSQCYWSKMCCGLAFGIFVGIGLWKSINGLWCRWAKFSLDGIEMYCFVGDEDCVRASREDCMHVCIGVCVWLVSVQNFAKIDPTFGYYHGHTQTSAQSNLFVIPKWEDIARSSN